MRGRSLDPAHGQGYPKETMPRRLRRLLTRVLPCAASICLLAGLATGCASSPQGLGGGAGAPLGAPSAPPVAASAPKAGRIRGSSAYAPASGVFNFGGGRRVLAFTPGAPAPQEPEEPRTPGRGTGSDAPLAGEPQPPAAQPSAPQEPRAADAPLPAPTRAELATVAPRGVRITWEALAVERDQILNPRTPAARRAPTAVQADSKIILVSDDHPAAQGKAPGSAVERSSDGSSVAVVAGQDLRLMVRGLREAGFFEVARPTDGVAAMFASEDARGRVTVEVDGATRTLLSMRGQGLQATTRDIPRIYSQAKQSVAAVRNNAPSLSVVTSGNAPARPRARLSRSPSRTLTPEEAAAVLGEEVPAGGASPGTPAAGPTPPAAPPAAVPAVPRAAPRASPAPVGPAPSPAAPRPVDDTWGLGR